MNRIQAGLRRSLRGIVALLPSEVADSLIRVARSVDKRREAYVKPRRLSEPGILRHFLSHSGHVDLAINNEIDRRGLRAICNSLPELAEYLLDSGDKRAVVDAARWLLEEHPTEAADLVRAAGEPSGIRVLLEHLYRQGRISEAYEVGTACLEAQDDEWIAQFVDRRRAELGYLAQPLVKLTPDRVGSLYLLHNSLPHKSGGYATRSHGIASTMTKLGTTVIPVTRPGFPSSNGVFAQDKGISPRDKIDNLTYHRLIGKVRSTPRSDLAAFASDYASSLTPLVEEYRPAIIHAASNWWNGFGGLETARRNQLPFVYEVRGLWELTKASREPGWEHTEAFALDAKFETSVATQADAVITLSEALREELVARGVPYEKIEIVPNAVDVDRFAPRQRDPGLAADLELGDRFVLGFAGSVVEYEGLELVFEALAEMGDFDRKKFVVVIVGDGSHLGAIRSRAESLGLLAQARFVGRVPFQDVARYVSTFSCSVYPRLPLPVCQVVPPIKPLETMSMAKPVIVSDVRALAEQIQPDVTGFTFDAGSAADLASLLLRIVEQPDLNAQVGSNARAWVMENRTWEQVAGGVMRIYDRLDSSS